MIGQSRFRNVDATEPIALAARQISREFNIKPKDAVHVATALYWKVPILFSFDKKLLKTSGKLETPPLEITEPEWKGQPELSGMDVEPEPEYEKLVEELHSYLTPSKNGSENGKPSEQSEILKSEQINEKENIKIAEPTIIEESIIRAEGAE